MEILKKFKNIFFLLMGTLLFAQVSFAEVPSANTDIGNQATLKFVTAAGQNEEIVSNIVITRVQQVYAISITPDRTTTILSGQSAVFSHTVTNNGNGVDSIDLTHTYTGNYVAEIFIDANNNGIIDAEENTPVTSLSNLDANTSVAILVKVTTPVGETETVVNTVTATSQGDPAQSSSVTETIVYSSNAVVSVQKSFDISSASGEFEQEVTVFFKVVNNTETTSGEFELYDTLDDRFVYVEGSAKWFAHGQSNGVSMTDAADGNEGGTAWFARNGQFINFNVASIPSGTTFEGTTGGYLEFKVKVAAESAVGTIENKGTYDYNDGVSVITNTETNTVTYEILKYVKAQYTGDTIEVANPGETLLFKNTLTNLGNDAEIFNLTLNVANSTFPAASISTANLLFATSNGDFVTPLDNNGDNILDTGSLGAGESIDVYLQITLTDDIEDGVYTMDKIATSTFNPQVVVTAPDTVSSIVAPSVDLTNDKSAFTDAIPADGAPKIIDTTAPGVGIGPEVTPVTSISTTPDAEKTVDFILYVNNLNRFVSDSFDLSVSTNANFSTTTLPTGITLEFLDENEEVITNTGTMVPESSKKVIARVTVAQGTQAGQVPLYFKVKSSTTDVEDIKYDLLILGTVRKVTITPETLSAIAPPNGTAIFTHVVKNEGNVNEGAGIANGSSSLTLPVAESGSGYTSTVYIDTNTNGQYDSGIDQEYNFETIGGLDPEEEVTVFLVVTTPGNALEGDTNTTTITVTASLESYNVAATTNAANDTVTIIKDQLAIEKYQSLDGITYTKDLQTSAPGEPIYYMIEITNTGSASATNVVIEDEIPQYTTLANVDSGTEPGTKSFPTYVKISADGTWGDYIQVAIVPPLGERGLVKAEVGELQPNEKARLYFHVKIDE